MNHRRGKCFFQTLEKKFPHIGNNIAVVKATLAIFHSASHTPRVMKNNNPVSFSPDVLSGAPVFSGTRVPVKTLIDSLEAGDSIDLFLYDFPSVAREQVVAFLEMTKEKLLATA